MPRENVSKQGLPKTCERVCKQFKNLIMKWKIIFSILFVVMIGIYNSRAQTQIISRKVIDDKNQPLAKATVKVKNGKAGTSTDDQGKFSLSVSSLTVDLEISFTGCETVEQKVNNGDEP